MIIKTKEGFKITVDGSTKFELLETVSDVVHWGWWVFWILIFWPALIITSIISLTRKAYLVKVNDTVWTLDKANYEQMIVAVYKNIK